MKLQVVWSNCFRSSPFRHVTLRDTRKYPAGSLVPRPQAHASTISTSSSLQPTRRRGSEESSTMSGDNEVSLLSSIKSDSLTQVQLHPLVILTVSDYVTRHSLRQQTGPIVGAIIGAQNGNEVTMENAFECKLIARDDGEVMLHDEWFQDRLQQCKLRSVYVEN